MSGGSCCPPHNRKTKKKTQMKQPNKHNQTLRKPSKSRTQRNANHVEPMDTNAEPYPDQTKQSTQNPNKNNSSSQSPKKQTHKPYQKPNPNLNRTKTNTPIYGSYQATPNQYKTIADKASTKIMPNNPNAILFFNFSKQPPCSHKNHVPPPFQMTKEAPKRLKKKTCSYIFATLFQRCPNEKTKTIPPPQKKKKLNKKMNKTKTKKKHVGPCLRPGNLENPSDTAASSAGRPVPCQQ